MTANLLPSPLAVPPGAELWQYVSLPKLVLLLSRNELHFSPLTTFEDAYDGRTPDELVPLLANAIKHAVDAMDETNVQKMLKQLLGAPPYPVHLESAIREGIQISVDAQKNTPPTEFFRRTTWASCWHQRDGEEALPMWEIYAGREAGLAIRSNVEALIGSLTESALPIDIGAVQYGVAIAGREAEFRAASPEFLAFLKEKPFDYEKEVRAIVRYPPSLTGQTLPPIACAARTLIKEIVVSPLVEPFVGDAIEAVVRKFTDTIPVTPSQLAKHFPNSWPAQN